MKFLSFLILFPTLAWSNEIKTFQIQSSTITDGLRVTGRIVPLDGSVYIESARLSGRVVSMLVKEGDVVSPGKRLLEVNSAECQSVVLEKKMAQERKLPDLLEAVSSREKQLGLRARSDGCELIATHGGAIMKKMVEAGSTFNPGDNLFTLVDRNALTVELDVPERDADKIKKGLKVIVSRPASPGTNYISKVNAVIPSLSTVTRTVRVRLDKVVFKGNPSLDEFVFGEIQLAGEGVLFKVPAAAVVFSGAGDQVVKITKGGKSQLVPVDVISQADGYSFIREDTAHSLQLGDTIASEGALFISTSLQKGN